MTTLRDRRTWTAATALAVALVVPSAASAAPGDLGEVSGRRDAALQERGRASARLDATTQELSALSAAIVQADAAVATNRSALAVSQRESADARAEERDLAARMGVAVEQEAESVAELATANDQHDDAIADIGRSARAAYQGSQTTAALDVVLGSTTIEELATRSMLLERVGRWQGDVAAAAQLRGVQAASAQARRTAARELVEDLRRRAQQNVLRAEAAEVEQERLTREAVTLATQQEALLVEARAQRDTEVAWIDTLTRDADALQVEMDRLAREAAERAAREQAELERAAAEQAAREEAAREEAERARVAAEREAPPAPRAPAAPAPPARPAQPPPPPPPPTSASSGLLRPVDGRITSGFGYRVHPIYGTRRLHSGTDFGNACGTPVRAAASGTVSSAAAAGGAGNRIIVDHGVLGGTATGTVYMHLQRFAVRSGHDVSRGEVIGYVGTTGASTGCHLHFEVYEGGRAVDPMTRL